VDGKTREPDILETMKAELDEGAALLRPYYPEDDDEALHERAICLRPWRYKEGRWPNAEELAWLRDHPGRTLDEYKAEKAAAAIMAREAKIKEAAEDQAA